MTMLERWWNLSRWELGPQTIDGVTWFHVGPFAFLIAVQE